jgi:hypothetical protein
LVYLEAMEHKGLMKDFSSVCTGAVAFIKFLNLSELQFLVCSMGIEMVPILYGCEN